MYNRKLKFEMESYESAFQMNSLCLGECFQMFLKLNKIAIE